ncbi:MAG TPA: hypothetical protein VGH19_16030 [Verrucomicrobiae bacterium]
MNIPLPPPGMVILNFNGSFADVRAAIDLSGLKFYEPAGVMEGSVNHALVSANIQRVECVQSQLHVLVTAAGSRFLKETINGKQAVRGELVFMGIDAQKKEKLASKLCDVCVFLDKSSLPQNGSKVAVDGFNISEVTHGGDTINAGSVVNGGAS